ncbi:MAG: dephospho-CoA kinase [Haliea sp.]|nr:dephospho-CoA kinase [Haliea sp.]
MSLIIGVTGGIGSGKSAVTDRFAHLGVTVVDADLAARVVVEPGTAALTAIAERFGASLLQTDGSLDRAAMRRIVFADPSQRAWLEALTHPLIGEEIRRQLAASRSPYTVLSSPLLLESATQRTLANLVVVVDVPEAVQLSRTVQRDSNDEAQVRRIMAAQLPREARLALADIVIDNSGPLDTLDTLVAELHKEFLQRAEESRQ